MYIAFCIGLVLANVFFYIVFPAFGRILFLAAAFFYSIFQVKRYRNNDFSSFWQAVGFGGRLVSIENFNYFASFWQDLGSGGCFFLLTFHLKKYCKMTCSSFWQAVGFGGCFFLLQVLKNCLVQLLAGSWQMGFNCNFWLKLFYLYILVPASEV